MDQGWGKLSYWGTQPGVGSVTLQGTLLRDQERGGQHELGILLEGHGWRAHPEWGTVPGTQDWLDTVILGDIARVSGRRGHCQGFREGETQ